MNAEPLLIPDSGTAYLWPHMLPGGDAVLFSIRDSDDLSKEGSVGVLSLETGEHKVLIETGYNARYATTGHLVFVRAGALWAVSFDLARLEVTGAETPMVEGVQVNSGSGEAIYEFSDDGLLAYVPGVDAGAWYSAFADGLHRLVWVDRDGSQEFLAAEPELYNSATLSPDGQRVALGIDGGGDEDDSDIWVYDIPRNTMSRLTFGLGDSSDPIWTPDGERIVYTSSRDDVHGIYWRAANGTGVEERLWTISTPHVATSFSPDGTQLYLTEFSGEIFSMHVLSLEGERTSDPLIPTEFGEGGASVSPDGRWLAYLSSETGQFEVYIRPLPDLDADKSQIGPGVDIHTPLWSSDGSELFYITGRGEFMTVPIETESAFSAGVPSELFSIFGAYPVGISADGERFLMILPLQEIDFTVEPQQTSVVLVENWFSELNRLAPPSP